MSFSVNLSQRHYVAAANSHYYKIPTNEKYIDRVLQYHDLIYIIDGQWCIQEGDTEYPLLKDDVLLLAAGRHHFTRMPCSPGTKSFCIHMTCESGDMEDRNENILLPTYMHVSSSTKIRKCFENIVVSYWIDSPCRDILTSALLDILLIQLKEEADKSNNNTSDIAAQAIELVASSPHQLLHAKDVADYLFVSARTLDNAMRNKVGMPFYSYQLDRRLEMVASLLKMEPEMKLKEIAATYDFCDEFYMSKAFKKKYGLSPNEYRCHKKE